MPDRSYCFSAICRCPIDLVIYLNVSTPLLICVRHSCSPTWIHAFYFDWSIPCLLCDIRICMYCTIFRCLWFSFEFLWLVHFSLWINCNFIFVPIFDASKLWLLHLFYGQTTTFNSFKDELWPQVVLQKN